MVNWKDSKYTSINDIKGEKKPDGTDFFTSEEIDYFDDALVKNELVNAQLVAELVEKVKKAEVTKKEDGALFNELSLERTNKTLAYKVVNFKKGRVDDAILLLSYYIKSDTSPKTEAERKAKAEELDKKITENNVKISANNRLIKGYNISLADAIEKMNRSKANFEQKNNLQTLLTGSGKIKLKNGIEKEISLYDKTKDSDLFEVKDFSGSNATIDEENSITATITETGAATTGKATPLEIIKHAESFLRKIPNYYVTKATSSSFLETELSLYNDRKWNSKHNLTTSLDEMGITYIRVLREVGADRLKEIIEVSPHVTSSKKDKLKKDAEIITKYISREEEFLGNGKKMKIEEIEEYLFGSKAEEYAKKSDFYSKDFLKTPPSKSTEFREVPDYQLLFEFMKELFPLKNSSSYELKYSKYLNDISDSLYIKPEDEKKGWEGLLIGGFAYNPKDSSVASDSSKVALIKSQLEPKKIESDTDFKTLTEMWWQSFGPFMADRTDKSNNNWRTGFDRNSQRTGDEAYVDRHLEVLRYCRTMRGLMLAMGISSKIDDYDYFLINIGHEALKGNLILPDRSKILERKKNLQGELYYGKNRNDAIALAAQESKIWNDVVGWENYASTKLLRESVTDLEVHKNTVDRMNKKVSELETDNVNLELQNKEWEREKKIYSDWQKFEEKDLPGKKADFETIYSKKDSQGGKWSWSQLEQMLGRLEVIKEEMKNDADFDTEFKTKKDEIEKKRNSSGVHVAAVSKNWYSVKNSVNNSLSEAIKKVLKDKETTKITLESISKSFEEYDKILLLEDVEKNDWEEIKKAIAEPEKYKDAPPTVKISESELKTAFGEIDDVANQALADKWGNEGVTKDEIKKLIEKVTESSDRKKATSKFISHLKGKGLDNGDKLNEKDDEDKMWKEFLGKDPERVANTINTCWLEEADNKNATKEAMKGEVKNKDADNEEKLDMTKYGATEKEGEPSDKGMVDYLWQKAKGGSGLNYYKTKEEKKDKTPDDKKLEGWKSWFLFGKDNYLKPCVTYFGILLLIGGILAFIFWENISNWWNGPAEEQGENKTEEDEEEKENE